MGKPRGAKLRKGRVSIPNQVYLITSVTYKRKPVFRDLSAGRLLAGFINDSSLDLKTYCYVIMPDHFHWLFQVGENQSLDNIVQKVKSSSGFHIKQQQKLTEKLWQPGYHDRALRKNEDVKAVARYVIANPLRAGLVDRVEKYSLWDACWL